MGTQKRLSDISRHPLEAIFQVMRVVVNYGKGQKQLKKIVLHPKSTLARPPIYDRAYPEMLSTAFPGNPVGITKPSSLLLFVQPDQRFLEESTRVKETYFLTILGNKPMRKIRSVETCIKLIAIHIAQTVPQF